ncbi:MAG: 1,4-alpha-glucan branching protein [Vulcanimicrobiaceae bacterium]
MKPALNFVLHAHLPWVKRAGKWPFGEEWLFQAMLGSYIPLLDMLARLRANGIRGAITLGITPVLIEMLRDPYLMDEFDVYLDSRIALLEADALRFGTISAPLQKLASGAAAHIENVKTRWHDKHQRDLLAGFRTFSQAGDIEIISSAATHAYLPLLNSEAAIESQLETGLSITQEAFGHRSAGVWLPECGFDASLVPILERLGVKFFYADERALGQSAAGHDRAFELPDSNVCYFVRHPMARGELMDTDLGYPGNSWYREFYKRDTMSGMRYWRVTDRNASLVEKEAYEPARALEQIRLHAADFSRKIAGIQQTSEQAYLAFTFDAELFGHWWGEGILWLEETLVQLHHEQIAVFAAPSTYLESHPEREVLSLPRSSWGIGGDDRIWSNTATNDYWSTVHRAQEQFATLARDGLADGIFARQAARELFLLQSSDWPFLMSNKEADAYPQERIATHAARFEQLMAAARNEACDQEIVTQAMSDDSLFTRLDSRAFQPAAGRA